MATNGQWNDFNNRVAAQQWQAAFDIIETIVKDIDLRLKSEEAKSVNQTAQLQDLKTRVTALENAP